MNPEQAKLFNELQQVIRQRMEDSGFRPNPSELAPIVSGMMMVVADFVFSAPQPAIAADPAPAPEPISEPAAIEP